MGVMGNGNNASSSNIISSNNKEDIYENVGNSGPRIDPYAPVQRYQPTPSSALQFEDNSDIYSNVVDLPYDDDDEKSKLLPPSPPNSHESQQVERYNPKPRIPSTNNYEPVDSYRKPVNSPTTDDYSEITQYQPQKPKTNNTYTDTNPYSEIPQNEPRCGAPMNNTNNGYSEVPSDYSSRNKTPDDYIPKYEPGFGGGQVAVNNENDYSEVAQYKPRTSQPEVTNNLSNDYEPVNRYNKMPRNLPTSTEKDQYSNVDGTVNTRDEEIPLYQPNNSNGTVMSNMSRGIYDTPVDERKEVPKEIRDLYAVVDKSHRQK